MGATALSLATPALGEAAEATPPSTAPQVASNPNDYECSGGIGAGKAEEEGEETPVQYEFKCNGQITGYQLQTQTADHGHRRRAARHQLPGHTTEGFVLLRRSVPGVRGQLRRLEHHRSERARHGAVHDRLEAVHRTARGPAADSDLRVPGKRRDHAGDLGSVRPRPPERLPGDGTVGQGPPQRLPGQGTERRSTRRARARSTARASRAARATDAIRPPGGGRHLRPSAARTVRLGGAWGSHLRSGPIREARAPLQGRFSPKRAGRSERSCSQWRSRAADRATRGSPPTITDTAAVAPISSNCPDAALEALEAVATRVYQESASGRIVAEALQRLKSSSALVEAVEGNEPAAARRALKGLLLNQIVSVEVQRNGRTLAQVERGEGIAPANGTLVNAQGLKVGTFTLSVQGANGYGQTVSGLLHAQVLMRNGARVLKTTIRPAPRLAPETRKVSLDGTSYRVDTFSAEAFPDRPMSIALLVPSSAIAAVCASRGANPAQAQADTLGLVAERVYYAEHEGSKAELLLGYAERSRAFREAVLAGNAKATRAAIIGFFRSHLHIVRVRVIREGKLLVDVGGPHVLAPIPGVIRNARGRVVAHFLMAIQDDLGFEILSRAFTGAQVLMREGTQQVMGTLSPGPVSVPNRGRIVYRGAAYRVYSFDAEAFPEGGLRISLLYPAS